MVSHPSLPCLQVAPSSSTKLVKQSLRTARLAPANQVLYLLQHASVLRVSGCCSRFAAGAANGCACLAGWRLQELFTAAALAWERGEVHGICCITDGVEQDLEGEI